MHSATSTIRRNSAFAVAIILLQQLGNHANADDWTQYGGLNRNGFSKEKGLLREWAKEGPPLLWKVTNLGTGFFPVSVSGSRLYTLAFRDKDEYAVALDRGTGKELWAVQLGLSREG